MKTTFSLTGPRFATAALIFSMQAAFVHQAFAVDPDPDWKTLIFPSIVPKAGSFNPPANSPSGAIRTSYETYFENYWKDTSYFEFDPNTGLKIRGFFIDTKTYDYKHMPWPIQQVNPGNISPAGWGQGEAFADGDRLFSDNFVFIPDGADADGVWTPGESFQDVRGGPLDGGAWPTTPNGQWDDTVAPEDFWNANNFGAGGFQFNSCGQRIRTGLDQPAATQAQWSINRGEIYADYNYSVNIGNGDVGFDTNVRIRFAATPDDLVNTEIFLNELDLDLLYAKQSAGNLGGPYNAFCPDLEGDMVHTYVQGDVTLAPFANIPLNSQLDYTVTATGAPRITQAINRFSNAPVVFTYQSWVVTNATTELAYAANNNRSGVNAAGQFVGYTLANQVAPGGNYAQAALRTFEVRLYQAAELHTDQVAVGVIPGQNVYGDTGDPNDEPKVVTNEGTWTAGAAAELFEDYLVFGGAGGQIRQDLDPGRPGNPALPLRNDRSYAAARVISQADYEAYIRWNYPGDADALIARAGNGQYDGPEAWSDNVRADTGTTDGRFATAKVLLAGVGSLSTPEPLPYPFGNWFGDIHGFPTWQDWWEAAFNSPAPAWQGIVANANVFTPNSGRADTGWIPANGWAYNAPREFCDLPSSLHHIGGDPLAVTAANYDPFLGFVRTDLAAFGLPMGDGDIGEITSPWSNTIYGQDVGPAPSPLAPEFVGPGGPDSLIVAAGPFNVNAHGNNGHDAGNMVAFEALTWRRTGDRTTDPGYPDNLRDVNLDGTLDRGLYRTGDPIYGAGGDGAGPYPFNRMRYMEDLFEVWDA